MTTQPLAKNLLALLRTPGLYAQVVQLSNHDMAELSKATSDLLDVAKFAVYARCHPEEEV